MKDHGILIVKAIYEARDEIRKGWKMLQKKTTFVNAMQGLIYTEAVGLF